MKVYLEDLVVVDMILNGYDPMNPLDVDSYWEIRLS
jgi:hypothetical protein